jgi:glycosyltransferase involved in cell wall biosynthesis
LPPITIGPVNKITQQKIKKRIGETKYIIGFAGRIAKQKGIPYLLNSIPVLEKNLGDFKIVFAGPYKGVIGEKYFEEINDLVNKYQKNLCFLGSIKQEKMSDFYSLCDVLVLPSDDRLESFGLVQVEAMLNGCPVVATDLPGVRVPIKLTGMGEIVPVGNSRELAKAICKILKNRRYFIKTKEEIQKKFDAEVALEKYEEIFS